MKKKHVTLMLLWEEYKESILMESCIPNSVSGTGNLKKTIKSHWRKEHKAGKEMEVDWAGGTLTYVDTHTGKSKPAYLLSQYSQQATIHLFTLTGIQKYKLDRWACQGL